MAEKGGQIGNTNAAKGRQARQALEIAIRNNGKKKKVASEMQCLVDIWNKAIEQAKNGNSGSMTMIMDRLDGRPGQSLLVTGDEDNPIAITQVERVIVKPSNPDS